jgi:undecaprenyl-diphosphatase
LLAAGKYFKFLFYETTLSMETISWWQAIVLGLVQGLTEFIPVSSSAHLNITHYFLGQKERHLTFDLMLHIGTLGALGWYFRHDWVALLRDPAQANRRNLVFLACVPAAIAGALLRDAEEKLPLFKDVQFNAVMLVVAGALLWGADAIGKKQRPIEDIKLKDALIIGASQAIALIPGVSRSGSTLTAGLLLGLDRASAARFSFLMSLPITLGAILFEVRGVMKEGGFSTIDASPAALLLGILFSAASGFWAIGFLLNYLRSRSMSLFFFWRLAVAVVVIVAVRANS